MATYGMSLSFDGYPTIDTSNLVSIYPLGTFFNSQFNSNSGARVISGTHPRSAPNGSNIYVNSSLHGTFPILDSVALSTTSFSAQMYGRGTNGCAVSTWADCRHLANPNDYGILFSNAGVNTVLSHAGIAPMRVVARRTYTIPATNGIQNTTTVLSVPELQKDLRGYQDLAIFIGFRSKTYTPYGRLTPINNFAGGANLTIEVAESSLTHASHVDATTGIGYGKPRGALTLYVLVCSSASTAQPSGYGIAVYNDSGNVSMSASNVPLFGKGVFYNMALPTGNPIPMPSASTLPSNLQNTDLILMPVGGNIKGMISWVNSRGDSWKTGQQVQYFDGNTVKSIFYFIDAYYLPTSIRNEGYVPYISFRPTNQEYLLASTPVMLIDGNDYFV